MRGDRRLDQVVQRVSRPRGGCGGRLAVGTLAEAEVEAMAVGGTVRSEEFPGGAASWLPVCAQAVKGAPRQP